MDQQEKKPSAVPVVFSAIALTASVLALICAILLIIVSAVGPESGGSATALTNRAVLTVSGMIFFTGFTWVFAMIGGFVGFIMLIVDIIVKRIKIIWIPIVAMVLSVTSIILSTIPF